MNTEMRRFKGFPIPGDSGINKFLSVSTWASAAGIAPAQMIIPNIKNLHSMSFLFGKNR